MENKLTITMTNNNGTEIIESRELAKVINKEHKTLMRDIRNHIKNLSKDDGTKVYSQNSQDFFIKSEYINSQNKKQPCYLITQKGCEFILNKLNGKKGTQFTAQYVNAFHDMKNTLKEVDTKIKTNGELTEEEWNKIKKKSKYLTENIYDRKSVKNYIYNYDRMYLQKAIDEVYNVMKPCCGDIKYKILDSAIKTLKKIEKEYDYTNPLNTFIKTTVKDGIIQLQGIQIDKFNNYHCYNENKKTELNPPMPSYYLIPDTPVFSFNKMYEYSKGITHRTKEYNNYIMNFPHMLVKDRFNDVDLSKPVELFIKIVAPQANDVDNAIKSLQDQIALALGGTDNNINDLHCSRKGICNTIQESKIYVLLRNK